MSAPLRRVILRLSHYVGFRVYLAQLIIQTFTKQTMQLFNVYQHALSGLVCTNFNQYFDLLLGRSLSEQVLFIFSSLFIVFVPVFSDFSLFALVMAC